MHARCAVRPLQSFAFVGSTSGKTMTDKPLRLLESLFFESCCVIGVLWRWDGHHLRCQQAAMAPVHLLGQKRVFQTANVETWGAQLWIVSRRKAPATVVVDFGPIIAIWRFECWLQGFLQRGRVQTGGQLSGIWHGSGWLRWIIFWQAEHSCGSTARS